MRIFKNLNRLLLLLFINFSLINCNYFLHITDVHLDPEYYPGSPDNCVLGSTGLGCCRKYDIRKLPYHKASPWGDYKCDDSLKLVNNIFEYISKTMKYDLDFIFFTGDIVHHHLLTETPHSNLNDITNFYKLIKIYFPNTTVYPCLGNHDTYPLDQLAPPSIFSHFLMNAINESWSEWLNKEAQETLSYGGYYTQLIKSGWRLIAINSLYYENHNLLINTHKDIANQFKWLNNTLKMAEKKNETVWFIGHIAPSSEEATDYFITNFKNIVKRFNNTILYQFWGHEHKDTFIVYLDENKQPYSFGFLGASLMTDYRYPSFRIFEYDSPNIIKNYYHYRINLNKTIAENRLVVEKSYNVTGLYSLKEVNTKNFYNLGKRIENNSTIFKTYCKLYYDTPFNYTCSKNLSQEIFV